MSRERHRRISEIFRAALELRDEARREFLDRECDDHAMRREVLELLAHDERPDPNWSITRRDLGARLDEALRANEDASSARLATRIGSYEDLERIGEGGMGEVYSATQTEPIRRRVALKLIKRGMDSDRVIARFEAERQVLAMMAHPNVAQIFDAGLTDDGRSYFAMELVAGEPITDYCDRRNLSTRARIELFLAVCAGVQHAHEKGIIHRDLKPSNLLVAEYGGQPVPKIIDFGIARATSGDLAERTQHTLLGQIVGTLDYMSPEQADPTRLDVDTRSDVYSLGAVLYQLLSGLRPFDHASASDVPISEIQRWIREVDPPTPSSRLRLDPESAARLAPRHATDHRSLIRLLSGDLDWITLMALEKEPGRRYRSAAELAEDLRRHLEDEPVIARPPSALYRATKFVRRHRVLAAATTTIVLAAIVGAYGMFQAWSESRARAADLEILADGYRLRGIAAESDALWPPYPERIAEIEELRDWVLRLVAAAPSNRATLERRSWDLHREGALRTLLSELVDIENKRGELLDDLAPGGAYGWSLALRLDAARDLERSFSPGGPGFLAWEQALPEIARAYPGLDLVPQMGLLPIGPDPDSKLWEFAHLFTGEPAQRDPETGRLNMTPDTGIVLVLLPGHPLGETPEESFLMGAQSDDPEKPNYVPQLLDFERETSEGPVHEEHIDPFFISKFEMTREQWFRLMGWPDPDTDNTKSDRNSTPNLPISRVSPANFQRILHRFGLALPAEEQWEYAARAGTRTPWWTGQDEASLEGAANLFDESSVILMPGFQRFTGESPVKWNDSYPFLAPIGKFRANAFGLHDVHGNVAEWNVIYRRSYSMNRRTTPLPNLALIRGGSCDEGSYASRSAYRTKQNSMHFYLNAGGVRPVREIRAAGP